MASQWPPRSPHEALLSTPGGRERLRRLADRTSPSPSPSKVRHARSGSALTSRSANIADGRDLGDELDDDDEDEEILQLKLKAIQARLKLKKLQAAKAQRAAEESEASSRPPHPTSAFAAAGVPLQSKLAAVRERMDRPQSQNVIQVPASPVRKSQSIANLQTSPQRVILGIDKGRKAADMSLARAPSLKKTQTVQQRGYLPPTEAQVTDAPRPMSFNERLAAARTEEVNRLEKQQRVQKLRSKTFSVGREEMEDYKSRAVDIPCAAVKTEYSRDDILAAMGKPKGGYLQRSNTAPSIRSTSRLGWSGETDSGVGFSEHSSANSSRGENSGLETMAIDPFSGFHLSKRILPHNVLTRAITGKKICTVQDLLRQVKAPDWSLPEIESDIVVFAIVASKSDPRSHKPGPGGTGKLQQDRGKYMVITLVDLTYEIELFLFNTGFERFWKLTTGTVLAILNPTIMPPPKGLEATGRFSLVINSDADTILEVGGARDLGYCKSVKKDGALCNGWVNARRTEFCAYHTDAAIDKTRSGRMELNGMGFGGGPKHKKNSREGWRTKKEEEEEAPKHRKYDREAQGNVYVSGRAAAGIFGVDERDGGFAERKERETALRRRLAAEEKEREIARRLSKTGGGAGKEYMTTRTRSATVGAGLGSSVSSSSSTAVASSAVSSQPSHNFGSLSSAMSGAGAARRDARALGLVLPKGERLDIDLGPAKRKRVDSTKSSEGGGSKREAFGWGSGLKDKLARMKDGERLDGRHSAAFAKGSIETAFATATSKPGAAARADGEHSPVRKKTRFVTEKGIREAGRESLGEPLSVAAKARRLVTLDDEDDDDDLVIIK